MKIRRGSVWSSQLQRRDCGGQDGAWGPCPAEGSYGGEQASRSYALGTSEPSEALAGVVVQTSPGTAVPEGAAVWGGRCCWPLCLPRPCDQVDTGEAQQRWAGRGLALPLQPPDTAPLVPATPSSGSRQGTLISTDPRANVEWTGRPAPGPAAQPDQRQQDLQMYLFI